MSYETFVNDVLAYAKKTNTRVVFDHKDGQYFARCSGGVTIRGNSVSKSVLVSWGSGHKAHVNLRAAA